MVRAVKFNVGDRVRVDYPLSRHHGKETVVTSELKWIGVGPINFYGHDVDIRCLSMPGECCSFEPHELIPLYDGHQTVSWSECAWKPNKVSA